MSTRHAPGSVFDRFRAWGWLASKCTTSTLLLFVQARRESPAPGMGILAPDRPVPHTNPIVVAHVAAALAMPRGKDGAQAQAATLGTLHPFGSASSYPFVTPLRYVRNDSEAKKA